MWCLLGGNEMNEKKYVCCICNREFMGWGNNPDPVTDENGNLFPEDARCCDECNDNVVIPTRLVEMFGVR